MNKILSGTLFLALICAAPQPMMAGVNVGIHISLPHPIMYSGSPQMIVLPETNVYVVPDMEEEIFFYDGWWWRPWEGRWFRSRDYRSGWNHYSHVPSFYASIPSSWRSDYREHRWRGHQWNYQHIPQQHVENNWQAWKKSRYWEKQKSWGVEDLHHRQPQPRARSVQQQRPDQHREINHPPQHFRVNDQSQHQRTEQKNSERDDSQHGSQQQEKHSRDNNQHHGKQDR
jgi:hypothetical protein